ncbi:MAG TPA: secondary thiamine-phosphate synthase enzyme YjbQ [Candidatus Pacearchaeota archaeon]|nr:secondary thiamine-phosphate synthase enzyme YjbQ [Candidatus Pacearchaeota archaeon]
MQTNSIDFAFKTKELFDFIDLTDQIKDFLAGTGIKNGLVNIQCLHTSAALIVNELEPLLLEDIKANLQRTAPDNINYNHDDFDRRTVNMCPGECVNGHSHCKAIHLLPSVTLNFKEEQLQLGQWQRVILVELDRARPRTVQVQIIGQ